jgi:hypothetical protein
MFLVELVMQGIRGFQQLVRLRFQGGFNIVVAGSEAGKTTCVDTVARLLFPVNDPGRTASLAARAVSDGSRAALVVYADDQSYYRVIQDFSKRAINLSKYNPSTKDFALLHKDWDSTSRFLEGLLPGTSEDDYIRLFVFRRESCSGQSLPGAQLAAAFAASAPQQRSAAPVRSTAHEARLAELRETLKKAEEAADAEYKADAARIRLGEIGKKLERITESGRQAAELEAQLAGLKACENLPENLADLINAHEQEQSQKIVKTDEVDCDIEALTIQRDSIPQANLLNDKLFLVGVAVGVLALLAGLFLLSEEQAVFFPLGILGSLLLIAAGWYNGTRKNVQRKTVQREIDTLVKERADIEKKFQEASSTIMKYMQATGSSSAGELKEKVDHYRHLKSLLHDAVEQQRFAVGGQAVEEIRAEYAKQQETVTALEQASRELAKHAVDTYSIVQEIERIQSERSPGAEPDPGFAAALDADAPPLIQSAVGGVNILAEIAIAARVSGVEMETLVPAVESAAQRNLSAASKGKYLRIEVGPDGLPIIHDRSGAKTAFASFSHSMRELACFCLRAGLVESIAGKRRLPFLLDDPFAGMDPARQQAACDVLRTLGTKTQVILFTSNPALRTPNDVVVELK